MMMKKKNYILIDSRDRDINIYKEPDSYVIKLNDVIKNLFSVKLVYALYPKHGTEFYTNLYIEEFSPNAISNNQYLVESFTQLPIMSYYNEYKSELSDKIGKFYEQPIPKLSRLTIRFQSYDGSTTVMGDHLLKFEIEYFVYDGTPELNKINSKIFNLPNSIYSKKDLNREYKRLRKIAQSNEEIDTLKKEYLRLIDNIS